MDTPLISVILATYNGSRFLPGAIESVLGQDFDSLELIVVDDASTDREVGSIIEKYKKRDSRISSYRNEKNMERSWSKNFAVSKAQGIYIAFIDDDDIWKPNKLKRQLEIFEKMEEVGIVGTSARFIDEEGEMLGETRHLKVASLDISASMLLSNQFLHSSVLMRRSIFQDVGGFPLGQHLCEDYDLWLRVLQSTLGANIPECLIDYRVRRLNTTAKNIYRMKWMTMKLIWKYRSTYPGFLGAFFIRIITFPLNTIFLMRIYKKIFQKNTFL